MQGHGGALPVPSRPSHILAAICLSVGFASAAVPLQRAPRGRGPGRSFGAIPPRATLPQPRPMSHPMAATLAPPGARPCQNTSPVPEPKAVGAAAPQCLTVSVVQDGDWGHRGLGAGSCEGLGAWWGTAQPRWAAHRDMGACAVAAPWGWSAAAP